MSLAGRDEKGIHELDRCMTDKCMRRLREAELERDEFKAHCYKLTMEMHAIANRVLNGYEMNEGGAHKVLEIIGRIPKQSLAEIQAKAAAGISLDEYDAGYLPDNPDQDYVRYELSRAYDFYANQLREQTK